MGVRALLTTAVLLGGTALADEVFLKGGGQLSGRIVSRSATMVDVDVGAGKIAVPASSVVRIEEGRSALQEYEDRAGRLAAGDVDGWVALAEWAKARERRRPALVRLGRGAGLLALRADRCAAPPEPARGAAAPGTRAEVNAMRVRLLFAAATLLAPAALGAQTVDEIVARHEAARGGHVVPDAAVRTEPAARFPAIRGDRPGGETVTYPAVTSPWPIARCMLELQAIHDCLPRARHPAVPAPW